jgi:hypothetical protein
LTSLHSAIHLHDLLLNDVDGLDHDLLVLNLYRYIIGYGDSLLDNLRYITSNRVWSWNLYDSIHELLHGIDLSGVHFAWNWNMYDLFYDLFDRVGDISVNDFLDWNRYPDFVWLGNGVGLRNGAVDSLDDFSHNGVRNWPINDLVNVVRTGALFADWDIVRSIYSLLNHPGHWIWYWHIHNFVHLDWCWAFHDFSDIVWDRDLVWLRDIIWSINEILHGLGYWVRNWSVNISTNWVGHFGFYDSVVRNGIGPIDRSLNGDGHGVWLGIGPCDRRGNADGSLDGLFVGDWDIHLSIVLYGDWRACMMGSLHWYRHWDLSGNRHLVDVLGVHVMSSFIGENRLVLSHRFNWIGNSLFNKIGSVDGGSLLNADSMNSNSSNSSSTARITSSSWYNRMAVIASVNYTVSSI